MPRFPLYLLGFVIIWILCLAHMARTVLDFYGVTHP